MRVACHPLYPKHKQLGRRKRGWWALCENIYVRVDDCDFVVPDGFVFNYASVPRLARWITQTTDFGTAGPAVHDFIYGGRTGDNFTRAEADQIFVEIMKLDGVPAWRRYLALAGVRVGGWIHWRGPRLNRS